jgi:AcrR family transcriptional regulator
MPALRSGQRLMKARKPQLGRRRQPIQDRAKVSVDLILNAAAELLDETGVDGFNTNLLATRAGVRVRTIYRYFPNKYSVIVALTERLSATWDEWMTDFYSALADPEQNWRQACITVREEWILHAKSEPGAVSALQAANATPELRELHNRIFDDMCQKMVMALKAREITLPTARLAAIARATLSSLNAGVELCFRLKRQDAAAFLKELDRIQTSYLETYLDS